MPDHASAPTTTRALALQAPVRSVMNAHRPGDTACQTANDSRASPIVTTAAFAAGDAGRNTRRVNTAIAVMPTTLSAIWSARQNSRTGTERPTPCTATTISG